MSDYHILGVTEESRDINEELDDIFPDDYISDESVDNTLAINYALVDKFKTHYKDVYSMDMVFERLYKHRLITRTQRQYFNDLRDDDIVAFKNTGYSILLRMLLDTYNNTSDKLELKKHIMSRIMDRYRRD